MKELSSQKLWSGLRVTVAVSEIKAINLLEHLPHAERFFLACERALVPGGVLIVRTDNAAWLPAYLPVIKRWGFAAHACDGYKPALLPRYMCGCLEKPISKGGCLFGI
jgi:hypothetical protein